MDNQNLPISGLHPLTGALTPNDLMIISQEQPEGWESFHVEVEKFVTLVIAGMNDGSVFLRKVHTIDSSGLIGSGTIPDALGLDWDFLRTQFAPNDVGDAYVTTTTRLIAGNGLSGGGALNTDRTIALGTPSTLTATTTNESNGETHTHELSKASTAVAGVVKLVDNTNSDSVTDAPTAKVAKALATAKADKTTSVGAGAGLTGGGDLSSNRTITMGVPGTLGENTVNAATGDSHTHRINLATKDSAGLVRIDDVLDSSSSTVAASSRAVKLLNDNKADKSTAITAGTGLTGGGNLTASRTIQVDFNVLDARYAQAGVGGNYVPLTRTISTGGGLSGGGNLGGNLTLSINFGTAVNTVAMGNDGRINNGQTAHSWGDHNSKNYLTLAQVVPEGGIIGNGTIAAPLGVDYGELDKVYLSKHGGVINGDLTVTGAVNVPGLEAGVPLGTVMWFNCPRSAIPDGWVVSDGQLGLRSEFPDLWDMIDLGKLNKVTETLWQIARPPNNSLNGDVISYRASFSLGTDASNFRFPDLNGRSIGSWQSPVLRGDGFIRGNGLGNIMGDAIRNITGSSIYGQDADGTTKNNGLFDGAMFYDYSAVTIDNVNAISVLQSWEYNRWYKLKFDASKIVPTSNENRPVSAFGVYAIKARGGTSTIPAQGSPATLLANQFNGSQKIIGGLEVTDQATIKDLVVTGSFNLAPGQNLPGTARAICNYNGEFNSILYSSGVASVTHLGSGLFEVVLSEAMPDANYVVVATPTNHGYWSGSASSATLAHEFTITPTRFRIRVTMGGDNTQGAYVPRLLNFAVFR